MLRKPDNLPFSSLQNVSINFKPVNSGLKAATFDDKKNVVLTLENGAILQLNEDGKPEFQSPDKKESVIEYSGEATDGNKERSWAYAKFPPKGHSPNHCHHERDEEYLITAGKALMIKKTLEGQLVISLLKAGDVAPIFKGEEHQIFNIGEEDLELLVWCSPSFTYGDYHVHASSMHIFLEIFQNMIQQTNEVKVQDQASINDVSLFGNKSPLVEGIPPKNSLEKKF